MSFYGHKKTYELRYSDCDFQDALKPSQLLALTQESACRSADELRFGYEDLKPLGVAFVIVNTYVKFYKQIRFGDALEIETWPMPPRRVFFEREYRVCANGALAAAVASRWCLVDFKTFSLRTAEVLGKAHDECPYRDEKCVEAVWKVQRAREGKKVFEKRVTPSECDHYFHANNTRYADYFFDCFSMEELRRPVDYFQISYEKQAKADTVLSFYREDTAEGTAIEARDGDEVISRFFVAFQN